MTQEARVRGFGDLEAVIMHRVWEHGRVKEGKAYRYTATTSRKEYSARLMREALADGGDAEVVLSHFIAQIGSGESEALRSALSNSALTNSALGKLRGWRRG